MWKVILLTISIILICFFAIKETSPHYSTTIKVNIPKDSWSFSPSEIIIKSGKKYKLEIYNGDSYSHGFFIEKLGINVSLAPQKMTYLELFTENKGEYIFSCSVVCGQGHYRMSGKIIVK